MLGMYIHMHWSYNHPFAARTWTHQDWRSYLQGLRSMGYDFVQIWPMLDSMPPEPNASDLAFLHRLGEVITMAQNEMGMRVTIVSCPNTIGNEEAAAYGFEERPYFTCERKLNPADPADLELLRAGRRKQFAPISHADAIVVIDSDPGGYIGSTNEEFVGLLDAQIGVMRELNPDSELIYWMHFGWENYCRFWEITSRWQPGDPPVGLHPDPQVFHETLTLMRDRIPEPWSVLANNTPWGHLAATDALGLAEKRCALHYGLIEGEPTFPFTNCNPGLIAEVVRGYAPTDYPRGFLANAQTHVLQLPHTYLVAEHWLRGPQAAPDLAAFAERVIPGLGEPVARAWLALETADATRLRECAANLRPQISVSHPDGDCSGLLMGSPGRFLTDLVMNLEVRASFAELAATLDAGRNPRPALRSVLEAMRPYQQHLGFTDLYGGPVHTGLNVQVARLNDPAINAVLAQWDDWRDPAIHHGIVPRLLDAIEAYANSPA